MSFTEEFLKLQNQNRNTGAVKGGVVVTPEQRRAQEKLTKAVESNVTGTVKNGVVVTPDQLRAKSKLQTAWKNNERADMVRRAVKQAEAAEKAYEDYINSEEYAAIQDKKRIQQMFTQMGSPLPSGYSVQEENTANLREQSLRKKAEELRSLADQYQMEDLMADIDNVAAEAEKQYQEYIHSEEYVAWSQTKEQERNERMAMASAMGINPEYQALFSYTEEDPREKELRGLAEYYRSLATSKREAEMMQADLDELASWSMEEQDALKVYALGNYQNAMARPEQAAAFAAMNSPEELFRKYGEQRVKKIAESYMRSQSQEAKEMGATAAQEGAGSGFWAGAGHSLASVGANLAGSLTAPLGYLAEATGRTGRYSTLDPNNPGQMLGTYAGAVRQEVAGNIQDAGFGKAGATVYQAGMSALDNLARMVAAGKTGSLALAASGSFGQAVSQYSAQGATPMEAVTMGIINGSLEVLTEKLSLDNILDEMATPKTGLQMLKAALRAGGVEVSEEELSFLGSTLAEAAVLREKSAYNRRVAELQAYGLTNGQAREQASLGVINEAVQTAIQSFLSGGIMSGITSGYSKVQDREAQKQLKQTVQEAAKQIQQGEGQDGQSIERLAPEGGSVTIADGAQIDAETQAEVQRIADFTGRKVEFYTPAETSEQGMYDPETGTLYVNANAKNPVAQVISHEMTHSVETAGAYKEISSLVMKRLKDTGHDIEQMRRGKRDIYARHGKDLSDQDVDKEIVAEYVAEHLLTNEQEITTLTREKPSLARRILNWLDGLLAKFGNSGAQERLFIRKTRDAYAKALVQTGATLSAEQGSGIRNMKQDWEQTRQAYNEGKMSDEEFEAASEDYHHRAASFGIDVMEKEDQRFSKKSDGKQYSVAEENTETTGASNIQNKIDSEFEETSDIDLVQEASEYPYDMQTVLNDYMDAVDDDALAFIEDVQNGKAWQGKKITVGIASGKMVEDIAQLTGVENKAGCKIILNTNTVRHIQNRHGENGEHDNSMRDNRDIARIDYVLQNYDEMTHGKKKNAEFKNRDGSYSETVVFSKKINGTYFVVEAVPNTGKITIVSAYINKNGASQVPDTKAPSRDVQNELASTPTDIVSDESVGVNRKYSIDEGDSQGNETANEKNGAMPFETGTQDKGTPSGNAPSDTSIQEQNVPVKEQEKREVTRDTLKGKAKKMLESFERSLLNEIGKKLGVPYHAKRDTLKPIVQQISDEYLRTGQVSAETVDRLFEEAYEAGVVIDREFFDQYKHVKDYLRTTPVTLNERNHSDIADYKDFQKRSRNMLKIVKEGGQPVDSVYLVLREMAPELFPASITHPADQLQRMLDVAQSIQVSEKSLEAYYGPVAKEYKRGERKHFEEAVCKTIWDIRKVERYAKDHIKVEGETISVEEAEKLYAELKDARKDYEMVNAKHLLTRHDEMQVGRLLRGEVLLEHLENEENYNDICAVYFAKQAYEDINTKIKAYKAQIRANLSEKADGYLKTANTWKDKKSGILYSRETMRRNVFDIIPDNPELANQIVEEYFEPVHISEAEATRFKTEYRDRVRALDLKRKVAPGNKVSEAYAVQFLGEAMDNIRVMEKSRGRMRTRDGKTLQEWKSEVQKLWDENPNLDKVKIENAVKEFRKIYDELFQKMNRVRLENGYEPVNYRQGYFPHFDKTDGDGIMQYFGKALGIDTNVEALPTTINGLTHTFKPGIQWFGNALERKGFETAYDAVEGFDKYIEGISSVIYHTHDIQKLRTLGTRIRYWASDEGIRAKVDDIQADTTKSDDDKRRAIQELYDNGKFALSGFVVELDEYTNLLANKKSKYDRSMESLMGRRAYTVMKNVESRMGANMIAGNIGSALTNFIPLTQATARIKGEYLLRGIKDAGKTAIRGETSGIVGQSAFLTNRRGSDTLVQNWGDRVGYWLGKPMEFIDNLVSEAIVRGAYYQNMDAEITEQEAIHQADILASSIMADRSKGSMPTMFESSNPLFKLFTQFQLEVNNQFSEIFKDIPREYQDRAKQELAGAFLKYFVFALLFNMVEDKLRGRKSALDPLSILWEFGKDLKEEGIGEAVANLVPDVLGQLPFSSAALAFLGVDGGRYALASALPNLGDLWNAATNQEMSTERRWNTAIEELAKPVTMLGLPGGGNQFTKSWKGVAAYLKGGSYGIEDVQIKDENGNVVDVEGQKALQYAVHKGDGNDFWQFAQSAIFGKSALKEAKEWAENNYKGLSAMHTAVYQDMLDAGENSTNAYAVINDLKSAVKTEEKGRTAVQRDILRNADISGESKAIAYYGMILTTSSKKERELMDTLAESGADMGEVTNVLMDIHDADALEGAAASCAKRDALLHSALDESEKLAIYAEKVSESRVEDYGAFHSAGLDFDDFMEAHNAYAKIDDEDLSASEKALEFSQWVDKQNYTGTQAEAVKDCFVYYSMMPAEAGKYEKLKAAGVGTDAAYEISNVLANLKPENGEKQVSWDQKCDAILRAGLSDEEAVAALEMVSYEATGRMIRIGYEYGIEPSVTVDLKRMLPEFDGDGNGKYSQKEVKEAIDAISGNEIWLALTGGTAKLTNEQKAVLWQLQTNAKDGKNNPYDRDVGKLIYDMVQAQKDAAEPEQEETSPQLNGGSFFETMILPQL